MKAIILLVFAAIVISVLVDAMRKRGANKTPGPGDAERLIPANEAPPTETGRLRVAQIVQALKKGEEKAEEAKRTEEAKAEEEKLPDPFEKS